ncbi:MAG: hypothetical protein CFE45_33600, partial [Burkholderiales bacterium PBB5]
MGALAARYRDAANASLADLQRALPQLARLCPDVLGDLFNGDPSADWQGRLTALIARFANTPASSEAQVWYGFVKDLIDQWSELRQALLADDGVMLPA